jgi:hypothetical protein
MQIPLCFPENTISGPVTQLILVAEGAGFPTAHNGVDMAGGCIPWTHTKQISSKIRFLITQVCNI